MAIGFCALSSTLALCLPLSDVRLAWIPIVICLQLRDSRRSFRRLRLISPGRVAATSSASFPRTALPIRHLEAQAISQQYPCGRVGVLVYLPEFTDRKVRQCGHI